MVTIKTERGTGLTSTLIDKVMNDSTLRLVVPSFTEQARVREIIFDVQTDYGTKKIDREEIEELRNRVLVIPEFFCLPQIPHIEGTKYLVDEGADNFNYLKLISVFDKMKAEYEIYVGDYSKYVPKQTEYVVW